MLALDSAALGRPEAWNESQAWDSWQWQPQPEGQQAPVLLIHIHAALFTSISWLTDLGPFFDNNNLLMQVLFFSVAMLT